MRSTFLAIILIVSTAVFGQNLDAVFEKINNKEYKSAAQLLEENLKQDPSDIESACLLTYINSNFFEVNNHEQVAKALATCDNPSPYLYAFWFYDSFNLDSRVEDKKEISFLSSIVNNEKINETVRGSARYRLINNHTLNYDFKKVKELMAEIGSVTTWAFTGVFDNTSGSGYYKDFEPIHNPKSDARFKNKYNADVFWFEPEYRNTDPWITFENTLSRNQGVLFAQTFANNPTARDLVFKLGAEGQIKVWVNDKLIIENEENQRTDMDYYQRKIHLPAGNNRILIQIGFTDDNQTPSFLLRFGDANDQIIKDITYSSSYSEYNKPESVKVIEEIPPFQETYFEELLKKNPNSRINRILLANCYKRAKKGNKAIEILNAGQEIHPDDFILKMEELIALSTLKDRTKLLESIEKIRQFDEDLLFLAYYDFAIESENKNFTKMEELIEHMKSIKGKDESYYNNQIQLFAAKKDYQTMLPIIDEAYAKFPYNDNFIILTYNVKKSMSQSGTLPLYLLEKPLKKRYVGSIFNFYINELKDSDNKKLALKKLMEFHELWPEELDKIDEIAGIQYGLKNYRAADEWNDKAMKIDPFLSVLFSNKGYISVALNKEEAAMESFRRAIELNPNSFESREKLRELEGKEPLLDHFMDNNVKSIIEKSLKEDVEDDEPYKFILEDNSYVYFNEGASTVFSRVGVKILNKSGLETWTEASIPYNYAWEELMVYKAEVHKPNGQTINGERSYNQVVFTGLEVGDVVYIEYRKDIYTGGKLAKEIFFEETVSNYSETENRTLKVYLPVDKEVDVKTQNIEKNAKTYVFEDFTCYEWKFDKLDKIKDEPYMPNISEVGKVIRIYTMDDWQDIADWYHDLAIPMAKEDYNINQVYNELFDGKENLSETEKAKIIYRYIQENIAYSSVSFRQSNYIPQKPMVTISTKLGDCKDVSTLYHTLAKKAGLKTNLVLVNTRYNGENHMKFPTTAFNHCIIRIQADGDTLYQELTDNKLPFGVSPHSINNAQALVIPNKKGEDTGTKGLIHIQNKVKFENALIRNSTILVEEDNLIIETTLTAQGDKSSNYRRNLSDLTEDEMKESVESYIGQYFTQDIEILEHSVQNLEAIDSSIDFSIKFKVKDLLKEIGSIITFPLPMFDEILSLQNLSNEDRDYPLEYWRYEDVNVYQNNYEIDFGKDHILFELPKDVSIDNQYFAYSLKFKKVSSNKISVERIFRPYLGTVTPESYKDFREIIGKILKAENIYISFKAK